MQLAPDKVTRFYRIWFALLRYVNDRRHVIASFPARPDEGTLQPAHAVALRDALWADDALRAGFIAANPAALPPADLALVESWRHRVAGRFFIERYLTKHTIFLSEATPVHAYGVLGLVSPIEEIVGPSVPIYVQAVLLPFEGRIIYDSLLAPYAITFGGGIRRSLREAYRDAQERDGLITNLLVTAESGDGARVAIRARNARVLTAFRKEVLRSGMSPQTAEGHVRTIAAFGEDGLLRHEPPHGLLTLTPADLRAYLRANGAAANRASFRRFIRFLDFTDRLPPAEAAALAAVLKES